MKLQRYFLVGCLIGIAMPALLIAFSAAARHTFESAATIMAVPGFLPFVSSDPEEEMSWFKLVLAFLLNALVFGCLALLAGFFRRHGAQPGTAADGLRPPLS